MIASLAKGPSTNDVTPEGEGGGYKKWQFWVIFKVNWGDRGRDGVKKLKIGVTSFMDGP